MVRSQCPKRRARTRIYCTLRVNALRRGMNLDLGPSWANIRVISIHNYIISGSVCVSDWEWFESHETFLTDKTFAYKTSAKNGLDIDSLADFLLAEVYLNNPEL